MKLKQLPGPLLTEGEIHLWWSWLEQPGEVTAQLSNTLSLTEQVKAGRYYFERDRVRFRLGRGMLRMLLAGYLGLDAAEITLDSNRRGKPELTGKFGQPNLRFNLSHSGQLIVFAFSLGREIGIDLEEKRPIPTLGQIAGRFFAPGECKTLASLLPAQQPEAFFNCWTRKEAYIKACGDGMEQFLDRFEVSLRPGEPARLISVEGQPEAAERWTMLSWSPMGNYSGAVVVEGVIHSFKTFELAFCISQNIWKYHHEDRENTEIKRKPGSH